MKQLVNEILEQIRIGIEEDTLNSRDIKGIIKYLTELETEMEVNGR